MDNTSDLTPSQVFTKVSKYCWSKNFLDIFRNYFTEHAHVFENSPEFHKDEHNLEYYSLFKDYLKLYENTLEEYLDTLGLTVKTFYEIVSDRMAEIEKSSNPEDFYDKEFIRCLLASMDYDSFYSVMHRSGVNYKKMKEKEAADAKKSSNDSKFSESDSKDTGSSNYNDSDSKSYYSDDKASK